MDASYELRLIIDEITAKQQAIMHQRAVLLSAEPSHEEQELQWKKSIDYTTAQLEALVWCEKTIAKHLNGAGKLGKLDQKGVKNEG